MGAVFIFLLLIVIIPILFVLLFVLQFVLRIKSTFKQGGASPFFNGSSDNRNTADEESYSSNFAVGNTELGRKRLNILKSRAVDVLFEEVPVNS